MPEPPRSHWRLVGDIDRLPVARPQIEEILKSR
jgi:hypothetical protein